MTFYSTYPVLNWKTAILISAISGVTVVGGVILKNVIITNWDLIISYLPEVTQPVRHLQLRPRVVYYSFNQLEAIRMNIPPSPPSAAFGSGGSYASIGEPNAHRSIDSSRSLTNPTELESVRNQTVGSSYHISDRAKL